MKSMTPVVAIMAVFTLAVCFILIGSIAEELKANLKIDNNDIGSLSFIFFLVCIGTQLLAGPMVDKFGHKVLAIIGFLVVSAGIFLLGYASDFSMATAAAVLLGIGAICCNTVGNTLIPVILFEGKEPARASNFGNAFFGLGYVVTPFLISMLISDMQMSYSVTLSILGGLVLLFAVAAMTPSYPQVSTGFQLSMALKLLGRPAVLIAALALISYMSLEQSMGTWSKSLMTELYTKEGAVNAMRNAGYVLALFGLAMAIGRFIASSIKNLSALGTGLIAGCAIVAMAGIGLLATTSSSTTAILAVALIGLVFAPVFPTIVGVTFSKYEPKLYGSIFGIIFSIGLLGSMLVPKAIGMISVGVGSSLQQGLWIPAGMAGVLFVISLLMRKAKG